MARTARPRRTRTLTATQNVHLSALVLILVTSEYLRCKCKHIPRSERNWIHLAATLESDGSFRRHYRMERSAFNTLVNILKPHLISGRRRGVRGRVPIEFRVAMTLRWLAGASYLDLCVIYRVSKATFFATVHAVTEAICHAGVGSFYTPATDVQLRSLAGGFALRSTQGILRDCVGAIDGLFIKTRAPSPRETPNIRRYRSGHKNGFGLNLQACCDSQLYIYAASLTCPGATNDSVAWDHSYMSEFCHHLPYPYFLVGDAAYPSSNTLLTPIPTSQTNVEFVADDSFNFYQSQLRITIERAFGVLVSRWGILWKPLRMKLDTMPATVRACIHLHNFCILEQQPPLQLSDEWSRRYGLPKSRPMIDFDGRLLPHASWMTAFAPASNPQSNRRQEVKEDLKTAKLIRPERNAVQRDAIHDQ